MTVCTDIPIVETKTCTCIFYLASRGSAMGAVYASGNRYMYKTLKPAYLSIKKMEIDYSEDIAGAAELSNFLI